MLYYHKGLFKIVTAFIMDIVLSVIIFKTKNVITCIVAHLTIKIYIGVIYMFV
ncbi:type II CAAX prenyl endopeptidase Rce1 family protein [Clostridium tarantellae]|uniref:CPBP family intramembrane metalloprotease n=1 Tax=Clostridium tarantellae TaxID=39493 RepID=A0A6I1MPD8_9CLOT|nr:CPBP family intramembrane metalloprotease [Clostridium tarantellae]